MRRFNSPWIRWAALVAAVYVASLAAWHVLEPTYLRALERGVVTLRSAGVLRSTVQPVALPGRGLALIDPGRKPVAVPQRILGADVALVTALILGSLWLSWRQRALKLVAGLALVYAAHLATILAQEWVNASASTAVWATWNLWTTLYQGKVVPIAVWALVVAAGIRSSSPGCMSPTITSPRSLSV